MLFHSLAGREVSTPLALAKASLCLVFRMLYFPTYFLYFPLCGGCALSQHQGCFLVFSRPQQHMLWVQSSSFSLCTFLMAEQHLCWTKKLKYYTEFLYFYLLKKLGTPTPHLLAVWVLWGSQNFRVPLCNPDHVLCRNTHLSCWWAAEHELQVMSCFLVSLFPVSLTSPLFPCSADRSSHHTLSQSGGAGCRSWQTLHRSKLGRAICMAFISLLPSTSHQPHLTGSLWAALILNSPLPPRSFLSVNLSVAASTAFPCRDIPKKA